jgi:hypothetical protein
MADELDSSATPDEAAPLITGTVKHEIVLGATKAAPALLDVGKLLATRLLIQAGSGGGKSWLLRRLLEQSHGMVRQIVFDPEGELITLAEQLDYTVCAPDSDIAPIRPGGGAAAARVIYESRRSAIVSLSEFELDQMHEFVDDFCRELLRMPQEDWHHLLVAFDEAQLFAPQHDKAVSKKALIDLARRGRKRGICLVCATQRLSELSKGVAGQLENKLIGLTTLDVDIDRAADVLGLRPVNAREVLRKLPPGHFIAFGPALGYELDDIAIGAVMTRHGILAPYAGRSIEPAVSHDALAASLRQHAASVGDDGVAEVASDGATGMLLSEDQLRQAVVLFAIQHGAASAANQFELARRTFHGFLAEGVAAPSQRFAHPSAAAKTNKKKGRRRIGPKTHLNALDPTRKLERVFGAAVDVLKGKSIDEVASRHGRHPVVARRWLRLALEHVDLSRLGLNAKHVRIERLRSHADAIVPRLKRALAKQKRSLA